MHGIGTMRLRFLPAAVLLLAAAHAPAQTGTGPTVEQISARLGVQPREFRACYANVTPAPKGQRPSAAKVLRDRKVLLQCLQTANPLITADRLDNAVGGYQ